MLKKNGDICGGQLIVSVQALGEGRCWLKKKRSKIMRRNNLGQVDLLRYLLFQINCPSQMSFVYFVSHFIFLCLVYTFIHYNALISKFQIIYSSDLIICLSIQIIKISKQKRGHILMFSCLIIWFFYVLIGNLESLVAGGEGKMLIMEAMAPSQQ